MKLEIRRLLSRTRRAVDDYGMIKDGDRIAVGVSGGKDSLALLCALSEMRRFYPSEYFLIALTVDMGFAGCDYSEITYLCNELGVEHRIIKTNLAEIIFDIRKESNPCALCARMRRGMLHDAAKAADCGKLALGHHYDDVLETFMMNLFNEGRLGSFSPVTYLDRKDITVIRPLVLTKENEITSFISGNGIKVVKSLCPEDKQTDREKYKRLLDSLEAENDGLRHRVFTALKNSGISGYAVQKAAPSGAGTASEDGAAPDAGKAPEDDKCRRA